jgi:dipeptidyl aminopeptidase/acylaminoacyl peptidase
MVANEDGSAEKQLAVRKGRGSWAPGLWSVAWSPNGKTIAVIALTSGDKYASLIEVPTEGGEERLLTNQRWARIFSLAWLRDGRGLIVDAGQSYSQSHFVYVSYPDGRVRTLTTLTNDLNNYGEISLTDDGRSLLALETQVLTNAWVGSLTDPDSAKQITSGNAAQAYLRFPDFAWTPDDKIVYTQQSGAERGSSMWVVAPDGTGARPLIISSTACPPEKP